MATSQDPTRVQRTVPVWVWFIVGNAVALAALSIGLYVALSRKDVGPLAPKGAAVDVAADTAAPVDQQADVASTPAKLAGTPPRPLSTEGLSDLSESSASVVPNPAHEPQAPGLPVASSRPTAASVPRVAEVIDEVAQGIVRITTLGSKDQQLGSGSGFVIDPSGLVATSWHVLQAASKASATFRDGTTVPIKGVRAWDDDRDLAILELVRAPDTMKLLPIARDGERRQAEEVIAIGHPAGSQFTTTTGIISAVRKTSELPAEFRAWLNAPPDTIWIQTSAVISAGSSGGPLLNSRGEVIGINTWVAGDVRLGFALDIRHLVDLQTKIEQEATPLADVTGPQEQLFTLTQEFNQKYAWFMNQAQGMRTKEALQKHVQSRHPGPESVPKFLDLAHRHRHKPVAFDALSALCNIAALPDCPPACNDVVREASQQIVEDYLHDPRLLRLMLEMRSTPIDAGHELMRCVGETSPERRTRGTAKLSLALALQAGSSQADHADESCALLEQVIADYADVELIELGAKTLGEVAEQPLYVIKNLTVGRIAPDIVGQDQSGQQFKLSEYRGKVVVLDFWADWCPHCVAMYPLERRMVERLTSRSFALLGVNCDERSRFDKVVAEKTVTWRNWYDGPEGPILQQYRVSGFPTLYVLDHDGVIRYQNVQGSDLERAVEELLAKLPAAPASESKATP